MWRIRLARYEQLALRDYWAAWAAAINNSGFLSQPKDAFL